MRKVLLFILPVFLLPVISYSQILNGRVLNESGGNAAGVSVWIQNTKTGTTTKADGTFKIVLAKPSDTLIFSAVGYEPYKIIVTEKNIKDPKFEIVLLNTRKTLNEVVVVGYRASSKKDLAYSTSTVAAADLDYARSVPATGLTGRVAGLEVRDGKPDKSTVRIRGAGSMSSPSGTIPPVDGKFFFSDTNIVSREGSLAKSKILTAGEVNDFNKWKMWEDYTANEFKTFSTFWGMHTNRRFSIQLTDKQHNAVMNEPVFLVNKKTKDTVWKAFTDNTGKAELWADFLKDSISKDDYFIADHYGNKVNDLSEFSNGVNLMVVNKSCQVSYDVDIAFVVDATGSMGDEIEFLKLELEDVIRSTMEKYTSLTLRASSVFYRDKSDEYLTKNVPFNDDLLKTLNFIKLQKAGGGGDYPEAVDDALAAALDSLQWNPATRTKLLFLVLDAPPHNEAKERIQQLTLKAAAMGIRIVPIACSGTDKSTEFLLRSMALATNGTYTFLSNHSGVGNSHIEPTTDKYEVELLNALLQRVIGQFLYAKDCGKEVAETQVIKQQENILAVKIYPNPTAGQFVIESKKDIKEIYITDFTGKILQKLSVADKKGRWQVDISMYPSGAYLVKYITADNKWGAEKVVLVH